MPDYRVYKYTLRLVDAQRIRAPQGFSPLSVQEQDGELQLWTPGDVTKPQVERWVYIVGTGHPIGFAVADAHYVGTVQTQGGRLVWHVFAGPERSEPSP